MFVIEADQQMNTFHTLAQRKTEKRHREKRKGIRFTPELKEQARRMVYEEKLSPELVAGRWRDEGKLSVSHETIYQWI